MSNYRVRQVLALGEMPRRQLRFLIALATYLGDESRSARIGFAVLTDTAGLSARWSKVTRSELCDAGRIAYVPGRYRGDLTLWTALCLPEKGGTDAVPPSGNKGAPNSDPLPAGKGAPDAAGRGHLNGEKGGTLDRAGQQEPERRLNLQAKPSSSRKREEYDDPRFGEFYAAYPRKVGKPAAWKAWRKAIRGGADPDAVIKAARRFAEQRAGRDPDFTPYPATWLNQARYDDEPAAGAGAYREDDSWLR